MKLKFFLFISWGMLLLSLGFTLCAFADHRLKVGTLDFDSNNSKRMVLIGIDPHLETQSPDLNFEELGFKGIYDADLQHVDPRFILELTPQGISRVYAFELNTSKARSSRSDTTALELPPILLDVDSIRQESCYHWACNINSFFGKSLGYPIGPSAAFGSTLRKRKETLKKYQAFYLMELIHQTLPPYNRFPELKLALSKFRTAQSEFFLKSLGESLLIRFNPKSTQAGISIPENESGEFFDEWRRVQMGLRVENKAYLVRSANETHLRTILMSEEFAFLLIPKEQDKTKSLVDKRDYFIKFNGLGSHRKGPFEILQAFNSEPIQGTLVPWYLVSFVHPDGPLDLANFIYPSKFGMKQRNLAKLELAREILGSCLPLSHCIVDGTQSIIEEHTLRKEKTKYLDRVQSYSSLLALSETEVLHPLIPTEGVDLSSLLKTWRHFNLDYVMEGKSTIQILNETTALLIQKERNLKEILLKEVFENLPSIKETHYLSLKHSLSGSTRSPASRKPASRGPASLLPCTQAELPERKPVVLLLVDGLRPDRFRKAAAQGLIPNLKSLFIDRGVQMEAYTSRALTLPSWSTIMTGFEPDVHGIKSNTPTSRLKREVTDDYTDPRKDLLLLRNRKKNRAFHRIEEDQTGEPGKVWLPGYFHPDQVHMNYMPVSSGSESVGLIDLLKDVVQNRGAYINGIRHLAILADTASAQGTIRAIQQDHTGKLRLVANWFATVDEFSHYNNDLLDSAYRRVDESIGLILDACRNHPVLKNAKVFLISDHGHLGGYHPMDGVSVAGTDDPLLVNTGFHLSKFLAGEYHGHKKYNFAVGTSQPAAPKFDWGILLRHFNYIYPRNQESPSALIDYGGDNLAQVYIKSDHEWSRRLNFYELSHFSNGKSGEILNIPADLLRFQLPNLMVTDERLENRIIQKSERHPVDLFAMALPGRLARITADGLGASKTTEMSTRDPVLILQRGRTPGHFRTGLILTRSDSDGHDLFRYVVLRNFSQRWDGEILAEVSNDPNDDPLHYLGTVIPDSQSYSEWHTDREWLQMARLSQKPTAVFALPRLLTLSPKFTDHRLHEVSDQIKLERQAEIPDFLLTSQLGFAFHSSSPMESDHGGLSPYEVRNSFFASSLHPNEFSRPTFLEGHLVLNRDFMPTILNFAGLGEEGFDPLPPTQGESFKHWIESQIR